MEDRSTLSVTLRDRVLVFTWSFMKTRHPLESWVVSHCERNLCIFSQRSVTLNLCLVFPKPNQPLRDEHVSNLSKTTKMDLKLESEPHSTLPTIHFFPIPLLWRKILLVGWWAVGLGVGKKGQGASILHFHFYVITIPYALKHLFHSFILLADLMLKKNWTGWS